MSNLQPISFHFTFILSNSNKNFKVFFPSFLFIFSIFSNYNKKLKVPKNQKYKANNKNLII